MLKRTLLVLLSLLVSGMFYANNSLAGDFFDVTPDNWAYSHIEEIYHVGITKGCSQNPLSYCPGMTVTRGQMAAFIIRALYGEQSSYNQTQTPYFSDVPSGHTFFKYVQKLKDLGITTVPQGSVYGVDLPVTRSQMAAFLVRARQVKNGLPPESFTVNNATAASFTDVSVDDTFFLYVQKLKEDGITTVTGTYNADGYVTRDQMAAFLDRAFLTSPWPMFGHDAQHTGRSAYVGPQTTPAVKWANGFAFGNYIQTVLSPDGTKLYSIGSYSSSVASKYTQNGTSFSIYTAGSQIDASAVPAVDSSGILYFGDGMGDIYALNSDFTLKWEHKFIDDLIAPPTIGGDGNIYVAGNFRFACITSGGTLNWTYQPARACPLCDTVKVSAFAPAIGTDGTIYFAVDNDGVNGTGGLVALNADGTLKWKYTFEALPTESWKAGVSPVLASAIGSDGTIYIGTLWYLYAINPNGSLKWLIPTSGTQYALSVPAIGPDGTVYIDINGSFSALNPADGSVKWIFNNFSSLAGADTVAVDANGVVYAGSQDYLYAINPDGSIKWQFYTPYAYFASPIIGQDGTIYVIYELDRVAALK